MKKKYLLDEIQPGSQFTADAYVDEQNLFVPAGTAVRARDLDGLKRWDVECVFCDGELKAPGSVAPAGNGKTADGKPTGTLGAFVDYKLYAEYTGMVDRLKAFMDKLADGEKVEPKILDQLAQDVLKLVREKDVVVVSAILSSDMQGYDLARGGVNCAILAIVVGQTMKLPPHRLSHLATGALLHDAGMLRVPKDIVHKKEALTTDETQKMRAHPLQSYRIAVKELQYPDDVGLIGLQHHERWDGTGYPRRTGGPEIDLLARIVSVVDAFEAMVSDKPYRNSMIGYAAMKNLLSDNQRRFDPDVLKAFIRSMGIYPIGSIVLLNNAAIARVVETHADAPLRPKIKLIVDELGQHFKDDTGEMLDLIAEKTLFIARALDPRELAPVP